VMHSLVAPRQLSRRVPRIVSSDMLFQLCDSIRALLGFLNVLGEATGIEVASSRVCSSCLDVPGEQI
jgi:hypothetical protein